MLRGIRHLLRDEERAANVLIWGSGAVVAVCFVAALLARAVLR
jgi:hypothetical protein